MDTVCPLYQQMWLRLVSQPILLGDDTTLCVLLRDGLNEEDLATLSTHSRFRQALDAGLPSRNDIPGSATSYAWLYTGLDDLAPYNVFHWSLTHQNSVIDGHLASSAHRHHLVIDDYLEDVLRKLADAQQNHPGDIEPGSTYLLDLLPDRWALAHPQSVRKARVEDREMVFEAKRRRRTRARMQARANKTAK